MLGVADLFLVTSESPIESDADHVLHSISFWLRRWSEPKITYQTVQLMSYRKTESTNVIDIELTNIAHLKTGRFELVQRDETHTVLQRF